jgi:hypothetical protein
MGATEAPQTVGINAAGTFCSDEVFQTYLSYLRSIDRCDILSKRPTMHQSWGDLLLDRERRQFIPAALHFLQCVTFDFANVERTCEGRTNPISAAQVGLLVAMQAEGTKKLALALESAANNKDVVFVTIMALTYDVGRIIIRSLIRDTVIVTEPEVNPILPIEKEKLFYIAGWVLSELIQKEVQRLRDEAGKVKKRQTSTYIQACDDFQAALEDCNFVEAKFTLVRMVCSFLLFPSFT